MVEERAGVDAVIVLDLSFSMLAEDIVPTRLQKAKDVIRDFIIRKRPEDRIALVSFSETSLILSYLTRDPENLLFYLDYMEPNYGTNIGRALKSGLRVFDYYFTEPSSFHRFPEINSPFLNSISLSFCPFSYQSVHNPSISPSL